MFGRKQGVDPFVFNAPMVGNGNDSVVPLTALNGGNVSFGSGIHASFNGANNSNLQYDDNAAFNFSNGTNDIAFEINFKISFSNGTQQLFLNKHGANGTNRTWELRANSNKVRITLYSELNSANNLSYENSNILTNGTEYQIKATYDGNGNPLIFVNGDSTGVIIQNNAPFIKLGVSTNKVTVGRFLPSSSFNFDGTIRDLTIQKL